MKRIENKNLPKFNGGIKWGDFADGVCDSVGLVILMGSSINTFRAIVKSATMTAGVSKGCDVLGGIKEFF